MSLALQVLAAAVTISPGLDDNGYRTLCYRLRQVKGHHWGSESGRRVAEALMGHLEAGSAVGFQTLRVQLPDLTAFINQIQAAPELENLPLGTYRLEEEGAAADLAGVLTDAQALLKARQAGEAPVAIASNLVGAVSQLMAGGSRAVPVSEMPDLVERYRALEESPERIIRLHPSLNALLRWGGLPITGRNGETVLLCGRSGHGKTAVAIHVALSTAHQGHPVDYDVIADASAEQIFERMAHYVAGLPLKRDGNGLATLLKARGSRPPESVASRLTWAQDQVRRLPISINDAPDMDQHELMIRLADKRARGVALSVMENLDHCSWDQKTQRMDRREYLGELVKITRQSDRATGHHTFWLVQANRKTIENEGEMPQMENTQDSDLPKNHCTLFISIHNPNKADRSLRDAPLDGALPKNRQGETGTFTLPYSILNPQIKLPGVDA